MYTCRSNKKSGRRWDEVYWGEVCSHALGYTIGNGAVVIVPVSSIDSDGTQACIAIDLTTVEVASVLGVHRGKLHERHGNSSRVKVWTGSERLWLVDSLWFGLDLTHGFRRGESEIRPLARGRIGYASHSSSCGCCSRVQPLLVLNDHRLVATAPAHGTCAASLPRVHLVTVHLLLVVLVVVVMLIRPTNVTAVLVG